MTGGRGVCDDGRGGLIRAPQRPLIVVLSVLAARS